MYFQFDILFLFFSKHNSEMAAITQKQFYEVIESQQAGVDYLKQKGLILYLTESRAKFYLILKLCIMKYFVDVLAGF